MQVVISMALGPMHPNGAVKMQMQMQARPPNWI